MKQTGSEKPQPFNESSCKKSLIDSFINITLTFAIKCVNCEFADMTPCALVDIHSTPTGKSYRHVCGHFQTSTSLIYICQVWHLHGCISNLYY